MGKERPAVSASDILQLLAIKHANAVFVPECKDGPTHGASHLRMDAWVMSKSWANPCVTAYEIKVSRSDYIRDEKMQQYLCYCNRLFLVTPTGLIQPEELNDTPYGLMWASKNGTKIYTKRKAPYRSVEIPEDVYRYVLMCRAKIDPEYRQEDAAEYWVKWLADRRSKTELGYRVGRHVAERVARVEVENERYRAENKALRTVKDFCEEHNVALHGWNLDGRLKELIEVVPPELLSDLQTTEKAVAALRNRLEQISAAALKAALEV